MVGLIGGSIKGGMAGDHPITSRTTAQTSSINKTGHYGATALFAASEDGHETIVRLLLDKGADITHSGDYGSALVAASRERS